MAHVQVHDDLALEEPVLVEGLPGVGLVGKIAADHLVDAFGMDHYATCYCDGLPEVAIYREGEPGYLPPVRVYADESRDLLALRSDVPVSPNEAPQFAECLTGWLAEEGATPLYISGLPTEKDGVPEMYGVATDGARGLLEEHDVGSPSDDGAVSGPTGALLHRAYENDLPAVGLVVQSNSQFPDPEAARVLLLDGIGPIADVEVDTGSLVEQAEEVSRAREQLAERMSQADEESSQAQPLGMYQ